MTDYTVAAEFTLKDLVSPALDKIIERLDKATTSLSAFQEKLDRLGARGLTRLLAQFEKLERVRWPGQITEGADRFDKLLLGADEKMAALTAHARELAAALKEIRVPTIPNAPGGRAPGGGGGRGGHAGGDPIMAGIEGGAVLEFLGGNYERYARIDQVYRAMQADQKLAGANNPTMDVIRRQADSQLSRYRVLNPLDVAKNAAEAYTIGGGVMSEQSGISDMLDRAEANLVLRGKSAEDAQRQATAIVRGLDVGNRFFNRQTGQFDITRANEEMDRVQALVAASNGLMTGQQYLAFQKASGTAGQALSLEGTAKLAHLLDINPSRTGTALRSFENLFSNGGKHMTAKDRAFWTSEGVFQRGSTPDEAMLRNDPLGWMAKHLDRFSTDQIDTYTQRMNVSSLVNEARGSEGNINRQAAAVARSDANANATNLLNSPVGSTIQFEAALERFRTTLGKFEAGPGTKILNSLTDGLSKLDDVLEKHPQATDVLIKLSAALAGFMVVRGVVALTGLGEGVTMLSRGLGLFAKGTAAEAALEGLSAAGGAGSLFGLAGGIAALGAAVIALPPFMHYLFGKRDEDPGPATNAHGAPYVGPRAPGLTPQQRMQNGLDALGRELSNPQSHGNSRGLPTQHAAYLGAGGMIHMQPVALTVSLDGREVARTVSYHQTQWAMHPSAAGNSPDPMEVPFRAGMPVAV